jgi:hypothetical protein
LPWTIILKVVQASDGPFGGNEDPAHPNYWKREAEIYQSGLLDDLPGVSAPRSFGVEQHADRSAWIWMEDLANGSGSRWKPAQFGHAAYQLGAFNGAYLTHRLLPRSDCLSRHWLRAFVGDFSSAFEELPGLSSSPLIRHCWPDVLLERTLRLWDQREQFFDALDRLPQTFCHFDVFPRNVLIHHASREVVVLDWSFAGIGAIGAELAPMVAASVFFGDGELDEMRCIDTMIFDAYVRGLHASGWCGDSRLVRLGYGATASLRYGLFPLGVHLLNDALRERFERTLQRSASDIARRWAQVSGFLLEQADEARELMVAL